MPLVNNGLSSTQRRQVFPFSQTAITVLQEHPFTKERALLPLEIYVITSDPIFHMKRRNEIVHLSVSLLTFLSPTFCLSSLSWRKREMIFFLHVYGSISITTQGSLSPSSISRGRVENCDKLSSILRWTWLNGCCTRGILWRLVLVLWVDHGSFPKNDLWFVLSRTHQIKTPITVLLAHLAPPPIWQQCFLLTQ